MWSSFNDTTFCFHSYIIRSAVLCRYMLVSLQITLCHTSHIDRFLLLWYDICNIEFFCCLLLMMNHIEAKCECLSWINQCDVKNSARLWVLSARCAKWQNVMALCHIHHTKHHSILYTFKTLILLRQQTCSKYTYTYSMADTHDNIDCCMLSAVLNIYRTCVCACACVFKPWWFYHIIITIKSIRWLYNISHCGDKSNKQQNFYRAYDRVVSNAGNSKCICNTSLTGRNRVRKTTTGKKNSKHVDITCDIYRSWK